MRRPARRPRRGMTLVIALVFLFVGAVVAIGFNYLGRSHKVMSVHAFDSETTYQFGNACLAAAVRHYFERLNDTDDPLYKTLAGGGASTVTLPEFASSTHPGLAAIEADFPGLAGRVHGLLSELRPVGARAPDRSESRGFIELWCNVRYKELSKNLYFKKRFKFVNVLPPVVSRFTLFVKTAEAERYNCLLAGRDGQTQGGQPLALAHGTGGDLAKLGWIYLGGGKVRLNLARGDQNFGEDFHLPSAVVRSLFFPDPDDALLHFNTGFYTDAAEDPLFEGFPDRSAFRVSALRLYGCPATGPQPSPTLVVGDVWRRYLQASAVAPIVAGRIAKPIGMPWSLDWRDIPRDPGFPPFLFLSPKLYQTAMSQTREEPYNRSYDYVVSEGASPTPLAMKGVAGPRFGGGLYPLNEPTLDLKNFKGETTYSGRLADLDLAKIMEERICLSTGEAADFLATSVVDTPAGRFVELNTIYRVGGRTADLEKLGPVAFTGRGMLVFEGDVTLPEVTVKDPAKDVISIVSLNGSIQLAGRMYQAGLVALGGEVRPTRAIDATGIVACGRLDPDALRRGGILRYDPRFNPENPQYKDYYTLELSPTLFAYREE